VAKQEIRFGVIGCGLMGREFASAAARWFHLLDLDFAPRITAVCDPKPNCNAWFQHNLPSVQLATTDYHELLSQSDIDAVYVAVPHHLHARMYRDIIRSGKHLLGEKPFGMDLAANNQIMVALQENPGVFARCSSEFPFYPGAYQILQYLQEGRFGRIIEVESGLWHSSDLDPLKPLNWKRQVQFNGAYGCLGDLGMHVLHIPLRFGWQPSSMHAILSKIVTERPDKDGQMVACETWDNALMTCEVSTGEYKFPMQLSTKRIAPGETNTWFIRILGTHFSAEYSTKYPKTLRTMTYRSGQPQAWEVRDLGYSSAYPTITGSIFEFGFSDAILQMWAAFCDELINGKDMRQPFGCATPQETAMHHRVLTAALDSYTSSQIIHLSDDPDRTR
jgi:predicted dehydrogenase